MSACRSSTTNRRTSFACSDASRLQLPAIRPRSAISRRFCTRAYDFRPDDFSEPTRMKRLLLIVAVSAIAATIPLSGQNGGGLDASVLKGLELRSLGPALATGRIQDIEIDPKNPSV